jgi:hypothetical protein
MIRPPLTLTPSRHRGDIDVAEFRQISHRSCDRIAVHHRKSDVEEDHVGHELARYRDGGSAIVSYPGDVTQTGRRYMR